MPVLGAGGAGNGAEPRRSLFGPRRSPFFPGCANAECASGRIHVWRHRRTPIIEGGWACSPACALRLMQIAVTRELDGQADPPAEHRHRVPLGLILLDQRWIDHAQLKLALQAKRQGDVRRIGSWLVEHCGLPERRVTQALSLQWNCPVFTGEPEPQMQTLSPLPRVLVDAMGVIPLRLGPAGTLYVAFEDRIDHCLVLAVERILGVPVEAGLLAASEFRRHHERQLQANFPRARLIEAASAPAMAAALTRLVEKAQPADARLVRVRRFFWLRMWKEPPVPLESDAGRHDLGSARQPEDVVCSLAQTG